MVTIIILLVVLVVGEIETRANFNRITHTYYMIPAHSRSMTRLNKTHIIIHLYV